MHFRPTLCLPDNCDDTGYEENVDHGDVRAGFLEGSGIVGIVDCDSETKS